MPRWNDGLVDAFPIPVDPPTLSLDRLRISDDNDSKAAPQETNPPAAVFVEPSTGPPLRFFELPAELRNRIYHLVLFSKPPYRQASGLRPGSRLAVLLASKRFHAESAYTLYTTHRFLVFPLQQFTPLPTIQELPPHYRALVANLEIRVGSSWTAPPKSWRVTRSLARCLGRLANVQTLAVFVEFDPSHPVFRRACADHALYTDFCGDLLADALEAMPRIQYVQLDGNPGVDVHGLLVSRLREEAEAQDKIVKYGKQAGWAHKASEVVVGKATNHDDLD